MTRTETLLFGLPMFSDPMTTFLVYVIPVVLLSAAGIIAAIMLELHIRRSAAASKMPGMERTDD